MRFLNRRPVVLFAALLVIACTNLSLAKKPDHAGGGGGGDGGGDPPPTTAPFHYSVQFIGPGRADDINNYGEVVVSTPRAQIPQTQGFLWTAQDGSIGLDSLLPELSGYTVSGTSINDNGDIAGRAVPVDATDLCVAAFCVRE